MSIIKSFSVGDGDMFYIKHNSQNFSIIDCYMDEFNREEIVDEIENERIDKKVTRFISTHPDEDHLKGLKYLDEKLGILNFYCVENKATKTDPSEDFNYYCQMRDGEHSYYAYKGCKRMWMNKNDKNDGKNYGCSGINFLWPDETDDDYKNALLCVEEGKGFNDISPVFTYSMEGGVTAIWMGDMEHDFMEKIKDKVNWPQVDILFAPHHSRHSGKVSADVLKKLNPQIIVIGEAPSKYIEYYSGYNTIKQNTAKDIVFECDGENIHVYLSCDNYAHDLSFLSDKGKKDCKWGNYVGSFEARGK